jgi:hypothetical protein
MTKHLFPLDRKNATADLRLNHTSRMSGEMLLHLRPHAAPDNQEMAAVRYASTIDPTNDRQTFLFVDF